jgi:hypothetical protein
MAAIRVSFVQVVDSTIILDNPSLATATSSVDLVDLGESHTPRSQLAVPDQGMAAQHLAISQSTVDNLIGESKVEHAGLRLRLEPLNPRAVRG